jgi:lycopene beta-cyclase
VAKFDILISGAGAAGLSLAYYLSKSSLSNKKILLLDKDAKDSNDRTWCFWSKEKPEFKSAQKVHWDNLSFTGKDFEKTSSIHPYHYYHVKGSDFYCEIKNHLSLFPNIEFRQEPIQKIKSKEGFVEVYTEYNKYEATWIFNSIPQFSPAFPLAENTIKQYFKGYFIKTEEASFSEDTAKLMDFSMNQASKGEIKFFYVLPFSSREALVECTVLSKNKENPEEYKPDLEEYIQQKLKIQNFTITEEERGMIPMTTQKMPSKSSERVFHIGTAGGMTKPSSGYTFRNIQRSCESFVNQWQLNYNLPPLSFIQTNKRSKFYDNLLLHIIQHHPAQFQSVMEVLFQRNSMPQVLKFLDEETHLGEEIKLFLNLPWKPFLNAIYEQNLSWLTSSKRSSSWRSLPLGDTSHG